MPVTRIFADWKDPPLPGAAAYLKERYAGKNAWDLRGVVLAMPTAQASRRMLEILVKAAAETSLRLVPPQIVTLGQVPELLYAPKRPFADSLTQQFAWMKALQSLSAAEQNRLLRRRGADRLANRLAYANMLAEVHRELASDGLDFADVAQRLNKLGEARECERWELLGRLQTNYLNVLDELELWDVQTARLVAIEKKELAAEEDILLVGVVDLNRTQRAMFQQVADRVTTFIAAPEDLADRFDEFGSLVPSRWKNVAIGDVAAQTVVVDGPDDQALAVCSVLSEWGQRYAIEDVAVGVPDRRVIPALDQRLAECGIETNDPAGEPISKSGPFRILEAIHDFLDSSGYREFANLVRLVDVDHWLRQRGVPASWLNELDRFSSQRFPAQISKGSELQPESSALRSVIQMVGDLLHPFEADRQSITKWPEAIRNVLIAIYETQSLDRERTADRPAIQACQTIQQTLDAMEQLPESLAEKVSGREALELLLEQLSGQVLPAAVGENPLALSGWLDLPWDDAPAAIVTGFNEGIIPTSHANDSFLPNRIREDLGLDDNERRFARDAYLLSLLASTRRDLRLIVGRRSEENDPLIPSRLLFAGNAEQLPARVRQLFETPPRLKNQIRIAGGLLPGAKESAFQIPRPVPLANPVTSMRVTEFSAYLECPYRYYLAHRLKLRAVEPIAEELPANTFGDLIHDALEVFGKDESINASQDAEAIFAYLSDVLTRQAREKFGNKPLPAVRLQIEQARLRLKAFARWQVGWATEGWRILFAECAVDDERAFLEVDGEPMSLRGRLDRIDVREHAGRQEVAILDYKTGDQGKSPESKHRDKGQEWTDLQLPLYRHLIHAVDNLPPAEGLKLGYILLPRDPNATGVELANWTDADLAEADQQAAHVIRCVRKEIFWPPNPSPRYRSDYAAICLEDMFSSAIQEDT